MTEKLFKAMEKALRDPLNMEWDKDEKDKKEPHDPTKLRNLELELLDNLLGKEDDYDEWLQMPLKKISISEKAFAKYITMGHSPASAARKAFGWECQTYSKETSKAYNLAKTKRIKAEIEDIRGQKKREAEAETIVVTGDHIDWENLRKFAYIELERIRDDEDARKQSRYHAIEALEKLSNPATDINLIWKWIEVAWRGMKFHCPRCHSSFPSWKVESQRLEAFRRKMNIEYTPPDEDDDYTRRFELIKQADRRKKPHPSQVIALSSPNRHLLGMGPARSGKSLLLAYFAFMAFLIPGVEVWVLSRVYDDARSEIEFLRGFLASAFQPYDKHMMTERIDHKTGEMTLVSRWGSEIKIKSAKAQGSITGRELEFCLVAEPAWVPLDLYEEVRARMSSRLGRILAFGTPKGYGGFLSRMRNLSGRDPDTGKIIRLKDSERLVENGSKWTQSLLIYNMDPTHNPEYVKSELKAARMELMDSEYDAEFRGVMTAEEGSKFPHVKEYMIRKIAKSEYERCSFVQGIDQGPKNFGAVLAAYDGEKIIICREFFDNSYRTMKANMMKLRKTAPYIIENVGGHKENFKLTIFDNHPQIEGILAEMAVENAEWPTNVTYMHRNKAAFNDNWRDETTSWINEMARKDMLIFDDECDQLLWQVIECLNKPMVTPKDTKSPTDKGWVVRDKWREDHVLDAWMLSMWSIMIDDVILPSTETEVKKGWDDHKSAWEYRIARDDEELLRGYKEGSAGEAELFKKHFGRSRPNSGLLSGYNHYPDY